MGPIVSTKVLSSPFKVANVLKLELGTVISLICIRLSSLDKLPYIEMGRVNADSSDKEIFFKRPFKKEVFGVIVWDYSKNDLSKVSINIATSNITTKSFKIHSDNKAGIFGYLAMGF